MPEELAAVRVWDLPTRAFHWMPAACVAASVVSAQFGGNAMVWHFRLGYLVFTLLAFRTVWGLVGGRWSRLANFLYAPSTVPRHLRNESRSDERHGVGHTPLGAFSVFGLLGLLALQVGTGLVADDEIANTGPLIGFVSGSASRALTRWHKDLGQWPVIALIVLHVGAILYCLLRKQRNLVRPMLSGDKRLAAAAPASVDTPGSRALAALLLCACTGLVGWVVSLGA